MPSVPGKSKWKERIAQVLTEHGALTERQIMAAIEQDTQHTRSILRNMLKAGIVRRERGANNAFAYGGHSSPMLSEEEIIRSFGQHPRGVREALRVLQNTSPPWLKQHDGRYLCTEVTEAERAACQSIVQLQCSLSEASEASTETESMCSSPSDPDRLWGLSRRLRALHQVAGEYLE